MFAFTLTGCTSPEKVYEKVDDFFSIKFDSVVVDSAYLANGFQNAEIYNDSLDGIPNENFENISLESLDSLEGNKVIYEPVTKPKKKRKFNPPRVSRIVKLTKDNSFNRQYIDFQRKVFEYKVLLKLIDTTKKHGKH